MFDWTTFVSNLLTIIASGIAVYLFIVKRSIISSAFKVLLNYTLQISLSELTAKLDQLNDLTTEDPEHKKEIINIFGDILGQIKGNKVLNSNLDKDLIPSLTMITTGKVDITDPAKRTLTYDIREQLRYVNVLNFNDSIGDK